MISDQPSNLFSPPKKDQTSSRKKKYRNLNRNFYSTLDSSLSFGFYSSTMGRTYTSIAQFSNETNKTYSHSRTFSDSPAKILLKLILFSVSGGDGGWCWVCGWVGKGWVVISTSILNPALCFSDCM